MVKFSFNVKTLILTLPQKSDTLVLKICSIIKKMLIYLLNKLGM